jgi:hypothetical protein
MGLWKQSCSPPFGPVLIEQLPEMDSATADACCASMSVSLTFEGWNESGEPAASVGPPLLVLLLHAASAASRKSETEA